MKLSVPYYSQYKEVVDSKWQPRACAVTCLKMALDFEATNFNTTIPTIDELIEEGVNIKAFSKEGWVHRGIVFLAHNHGVPAYQEEFRSMDGRLAKKLVTTGHSKLINRLKDGKTSIVSVEKGFNEGGGFHQIILVGYRDGNFLYHEPESKDNVGAFMRVSDEEFLNHWRHMAIFVG
ncbi:MAG TPA: hypothetical protein ENI63_02130 [Candidatus Kaiserbacteria bacterium]|nr:hypothetical protein [Candidatus Kaiserbacteria bacterium]